MGLHYCRCLPPTSRRQPARASRHPGVFCHAGVGEARASGPEFHRFLASDPCRWAAICVNRCDSQVSRAEASVSFAPPYFFLINQTPSLPTHSFSSRHCWPFVLLFWAIRCWHFQGGRLTCPFASSLSLLSFLFYPGPLSNTPRRWRRRATKTKTTASCSPSTASGLAGRILPSLTVWISCRCLGLFDSRTTDIILLVAFLSALVIGCSLHYHKIVKNEWYGYPDEWFPSVSATIGDRYPERSIFMILIAITSGTFSQGLVV